MNTNIPPAVIALLVAPLLATADRCGPAEIESRILTNVTPDGVIERAICQPAAAAPARAIAPERWSELGRWDICSVDPEKWDGSLAARPGSPPDDGASATFAALGRFAEVADIPDHHRIMVGDSTRLSHLVPVYERRDYGFVVEHIWRETLTETTSPQQARAAASQMTGLEVRVASAAISQAFGADYDVEALLAWLPGYWAARRSALTECLMEMTTAGKPQPGGCDSDVNLDEALAARMAQAGYAGAGDDGVAFVRSQALASMRQPDGAPPGEDPARTIAEIVEWMLDPTKILQGAWPSDISSDTRARAWAALGDAMVAEAGSVEGFVEQERLLGDAAWGAWARLVVTNSTDRFKVGLRLPGTIIATNGTASGWSGAAWDIQATCAYPSGYTMWARSLEPRTDVQLALLNAQPFVTREQVMEFADLVRADPMLTQALSRSAQAGSLQPLYDFRAAAGGGDRTDRQRRLARLWQMLGLQ